MKIHFSRQMDFLFASSLIYGVVHFQQFISNILPIFLYLFRIFGYITITIRETKLKNMVYNIVKNDFYLSMDGEEENPIGLVIPYNILKNRYIMYRSEYEQCIYIFTTKEFYRKNILTSVSDKKETCELSLVPSSSSDENENTEKTIKLMTRSGDHGYVRYSLRNMTFNYTFYDSQKEMYAKVMDFYNKNRYARVFIEGPTNVGKTCFSYLLAKELQTTLCTTFRPTEPSESLDQIYTKQIFTAEKPLILLLDEVDNILVKITEGIPCHKQYIIRVKNKSDWNEMLDQIKLNVYPYLMLIMCSNKSKSEIDEIDPSYLGPGRVDLTFKMSGKDDMLEYTNV